MTALDDVLVPDSCKPETDHLLVVPSHTPRGVVKRPYLRPNAFRVGRCNKLLRYGVELGLDCEMQSQRLMTSSSHRAASRKPTIALLSDHALFREGVVQLLNLGGYARVAEFDRGAQLLAAATAQPPAVVIVDLDHEREDTLTLVQTLRRALPQSHVVAIGTSLRRAAADTTNGVETPAARSADLARATADDRQPSLTLLRELRQWQQVTRRQRDVMRWLTEGLDNLAIAHKLKIGDRAVKAHVTKMLDTFHLDNRTQLALLAQRAGLHPPRQGSSGQAAQLRRP